MYKIFRVCSYVANKAVIASRIDCFTDNPTDKFGIEMKEQVEERLRYVFVFVEGLLLLSVAVFEFGGHGFVFLKKILFSLYKSRPL